MLARTLLAAIVVVGPCSVGCVGTSAPLDGGADAPRLDTPSTLDAPDAPGDPCADLDCDDGNPCTTDTCVGGTCEHADATVPCDDGDYCNGADTCEGGACTGHAGDPCAAPTLCDETADACVGCLAASDCPGGGTVTGDCVFGSSCATTGSRTDTVYECVAGACVGTATDVGCDRPTEGDVCGDEVVTSGACTPLPGTCNESGHATVTTVTPTCHGGSCVDDARTESAPCMLDRDGELCGANGCSDWGACMAPGFACTGIHTRMCARSSCVDGACVLRSEIDSEDCFRDGVTCPLFPMCSPTCSATPCGSAGGCSQACVEPEGACSAGFCQPTGVTRTTCMPCACP